MSKPDAASKYLAALNDVIAANTGLSVKAQHDARMSQPADPGDYASLAANLQRFLDGTASIKMPEQYEGPANRLRGATEKLVAIATERSTSGAEDSAKHAKSFAQAVDAWGGAAALLARELGFGPG